MGSRKTNVRAASLDQVELLSNSMGTFVFSINSITRRFTKDGQPSLSNAFPAELRSSYFERSFPEGRLLFRSELLHKFRNVVRVRRTDQLHRP